jgi:hypothetical protein
MKDGRQAVGVVDRVRVGARVQQPARQGDITLLDRGDERLAPAPRGA